MKKDSPRIVFMGTPDFAVASLAALVEHGYNVVAVVTAPDKPAGRGMKLSASAVKTFANENNIPVLQPEKLKDPDFVNRLKAFNADIQVVVAFRMLPEIVWNMPPYGTINVHASLLPRYRGAAPINWAVINGEKETGVTTFKLVHEIDTGNILLQRKVAIEDEDNAGTVHDKLKVAGAELIVETIAGLMDNSIQEKPQPAEKGVTHAPKIYTETCRIDWSRRMEEINNLVRGLSPFPGAFTMLEGKQLKVFKTAKVPSPTVPSPGTIESDNKTYLRFAAINGYVSVTEMQLEGKKRMGIEEFLRGYRTSFFSN
jgi:methionyl-tRNA formyltransferase